MTQQEEQAAADAAAKETADAEFEADIANLPPEEQETKRKEHAAQTSDTQREKELDEELAAEVERKRVADEAFKKREDARKKREEEAAAAGGNKEPLDTDDIIARAAEAGAEAATKVTLQNSALTIARTLATSDKEAQLMVAKWNNRSFPASMPLQQQMEEMYGAVNYRRLAGERSEALRIARNKGNVNTNGAASHIDGPAAGEPKLPEADISAMKASGFIWDGAMRVYKKPLNGGKTHLYKDPKTNRMWRAR